MSNPVATAPWKESICKDRGIDRPHLNVWLANMEKVLRSVKAAAGPGQKPLGNQGVQGSVVSWVGANFRAEEARAWIERGGCKDAMAAKFLRDQGFTPEQVAVPVPAAWTALAKSEVGGGAVLVPEALGKGFLPYAEARQAVAVSLIAATVRQAGLSSHRGYKPEMIAEHWHQTGFTPALAAAWMQESRIAQPSAAASLHFACRLTPRQASKHRLLHPDKPKGKDNPFDTVGRLFERGHLSLRETVDWAHAYSVKNHARQITLALEHLEAKKPLCRSAAVLQEEAAQWAKLGFDCEEVFKWAGDGPGQAHCPSPDVAARLRDAGISPEEAATLTGSGIEHGRDTLGAKVVSGSLTVEEAGNLAMAARGARYYGKGLAVHPEIEKVLHGLRAERDFLGRGETPRVIAARWADAGFAAAEVERWAAQARCFAPESAAVLRREGFTADQVGRSVEMRDQGVILKVSDGAGEDQDRLPGNFEASLEAVRAAVSTGEADRWRSWMVWANERETGKCLPVADSTMAQTRDAAADPAHPQLCRYTYGYLHAANELSTGEAARIIRARAEREAQGQSAADAAIYMPSEDAGEPARQPVLPG